MSNAAQVLEGLTASIADFGHRIGQCSLFDISKDQSHLFLCVSHRYCPTDATRGPGYVPNLALNIFHVGYLPFGFANGDFERTVREKFADGHLVDLADACTGQFGNECKVLGHPPLRDSRPKV